MKNSKYSLIKFGAIVFIILALIYPGPNQRIESAVHPDDVSLSTPRPMTRLDESRLNTPIEQFLEPGYSPQFDLAAILSQEQRERQVSAANEDFSSYQVIASAARPRKGEVNP